MISALNFTSEEAYYEALDEEMGDGYSNESQRAFAHSRNTIEIRNDRNKINALVAAGRFVVANHYPAFCPHTDAILGEATVIVSDHATREEANAAFDLLAADADSDFYYSVEPFERPAAPAVHYTSAVDLTDECPF